MKEEFRVRILREKVVDTKRYRYKLWDTPRHVDIRRIDIKDVGTTKPLKYEEWSLVEIVEKKDISAIPMSFLER